MNLLFVYMMQKNGNVDLIEDGNGGFLCNPDDIEGFAKAINKLAIDEDLRKSLGFKNFNTIKQFDVENVKKVMKEIYIDILGGDFNEKA